MNKKYNNIEFTIGNNLEQVVDELLHYKRIGLLVCGKFNGTMLYSDTVTMDEVYKAITGKTKAEFDKQIREREEKCDKQKCEHKEKIPALTREWMQKGRQFLTEDKWEYWDEIVPIRLNDLYHGMELGCCLDIVEILNNDGTLDEAKNEIESQRHSGMSYSLVCVMVREFCDRGQEFVEYVKY